MPVHNWNLVEAGIFHSFHTVWTGAIHNALNEGLLPEGYYALAEQHAGRRRSLAIRYVSGHPLVALLEIVSPAKKDRAEHVDDFVSKALSALECGVHLLLVDLFPPGSYDPYAELAEMPLFLSPDRYISVLLETTYQSAYRGTPAFWKNVLEGRA